MPHNEPDPTDPMTLRGVAVETDDPSAMRKMAVCFIDEFMRMGYEQNRLLSMFKIPKYAGPYMAFKALGEDAIAQLIDDNVARWGGRRAPNPLKVIDPRR